MKQTYTLAHPQARQRAVQAVMDAPDGHVVVVREPTRNLEQSAKFHAMCGDVARSWSWMGKKLTAEQWKLLFVSGHSIATGSGAEMVPGLEDEFVNLRESTARMSKKRIASLIEYVTAYCAQNGIKVSDGERNA